MALKPMSRKTPGSKRPVEQYDPQAKKRANNPPVGLVDAKSDAITGKQAEIDESWIEAYRGPVSLPLAPGKHSRVTMKIGEERGIESLKLFEVQ